MIGRLRERWGGGIRPSIHIDRDEYPIIERWDGDGVGPGWCITFEGFGLTGTLFIGRTPPRSGAKAQPPPKGGSPCPLSSAE